MDYERLLQKTCQAAGKEIMKRRMHIAAAKEKSAGELVTPADVASQEVIVSLLKKATPEFPIYAEETGEHKSQAQDRWIVDPIDGTTPWVWGNSGFSISIALEKNGDVILGAVYDPVFKEFFYAEKGTGATRNGEPIETDKTRRSPLLAVVDWGSSSKKSKEGLNYFKTYLASGIFSKAVPQMAPALGLCRIAEGRVHALICNDTLVEDHAAGALILKEAGGHVTNFYQRKTFNHREDGIVAAASKSLHKKL